MTNNVWVMNSSKDFIKAKQDMLAGNFVSAPWESIWPRNQGPISSLSQTQAEKQFNQWKTANGYKKNFSQQSLAKIFMMRQGDYAWMRINALWYLTEIAGNTVYFDPTGLGVKNDDPHRIKTAPWKQIGTDSNVPGSVSIFRRGGAITRISAKSDPDIYSVSDALYHDNTPHISKQNIYSYIGPNGLEDLIGVYLQRKGYIILPSSNKTSSEKYEYTLLDKSGDQVLVQAKNGAKDLEIDAYTGDLRNGVSEIWLVTTSGEILDSDKHNLGNIVKLTSAGVKCFPLNLLTNFMFDPKNQTVLPPFVRKWLAMAPTSPNQTAYTTTGQP